MPFTIHHKSVPHPCGALPSLQSQTQPTRQLRLHLLFSSRYLDLRENYQYLFLTIVAEVVAEVEDIVVAEEGDILVVAEEENILAVAEEGDILAVEVGDKMLVVVEGDTPAVEEEDMPAVEEGVLLAVVVVEAGERNKLAEKKEDTLPDCMGMDKPERSLGLPK
ncbi:hypothetical protein DFQ28_000373 [Apophysomyces sp. BC1034]|nr:hypothetical protein DFQ28_000373 [Apophysomyces sp. BC1034]